MTLDDCLHPMPFAGEALRFDLAAFRSTVTRQMLQARIRLTARAFGTGPELVAANLTPDATALEVEAAGLLGANAAVRSSLESGPVAGVVHLRALSAAPSTLDRRAGRFAATVSRGAYPSRDHLAAYVEASLTSQALGALKFCLPDTLRRTLASLLPEPGLVDSLLAPDGPTLWSTVRPRELALARVRLRRPAADYRRRLVEHRRAYGYLNGEDVDFRDSETLEALDARVATVGSGGLDGLAAERRRLSRSLAEDRAAKARARNAFAVALERADDTATLVAQTLLARALAEHEDTNRRAKMRLLRDLRDLADLAGLDVERAGLEDFAAGCAPDRRMAVAR